MQSRRSRLISGGNAGTTEDMSDMEKSLEMIKSLEERRNWLVASCFALLLQQEEQEKIRRILSQYRHHVYDTTDNPQELKTHLVFNEAQYDVYSVVLCDLQALRQYDEDLINEKEVEIVGLKKRASVRIDSDSLHAENSNLRVDFSVRCDCSVSLRMSVVTTV